MKYDAELLKQQNDLRDHVARYTTLRRASHNELCGPCPKCAGTDRLHVKADTFFCRQCYDLGNGKSHDLFGWYEWVEGWDFLATCKNLAGDLPSSTAIARPEPKHERSLGIPQSDELQTAAMAIAVDCAGQLWEPEGAKARDWLHARGLRDETLKAHLVGFNDVAGGRHGLYVHRGITIPHWQESTNTISGIKVRLSTNKPDNKYRSVAGSRPSLYMADNLVGHDVGVICEGEFDALLLAQEAGDLVGVCALGSVSNGQAAIGAGLAFLVNIPRLLVALDNDGPGQKAAAAILARTKRARRLNPPQGNDVTDYWKAGGDLRAWIVGALAGLDLPQQGDPVAAWAVEHLGAVVAA